MHYIVREGKEKSKGRYWQQQPGPDPDPQPWVDGKRERPTTFTSENVEMAEQIAEGWGGRVVRRLDPEEVKRKAGFVALRSALEKLERTFTQPEHDELLYRLYAEMMNYGTGPVDPPEVFLARRQQRRGVLRPAPLLWLLISVFGEAAEVIQHIDKRMKYGSRNGDHKNDANLAYELDDLRAALELLGERFPIFEAIRSRIVNKKAKLLSELPRDWEIHG